MASLAPPALIRNQGGFHLSSTLSDDKGARAHGCLSRRTDFLRVTRHHGDFGRTICFRPFLVHDKEAIHSASQDRVRRMGNELDRMVADLARFLDAGKGNFHLSVLIGHPFVAEEHIVRGEIIAVTEFHALPQIEAPDRGIVGNGPGFCQGRLDLQITVPAHQTLIDVAQKSDGKGNRMGMRIKAVRISLEAPAKLFRVGASRADHNHRESGGHRKKNAFHSFSPFE